MIHEPSYYAVIPAPVRYDKSLSSSAKLLYGEISALCTERGYCWASNPYFAELYDVSIDSVSAWISALAKRGHIYIDPGKERGFKRHIYLSETAKAMGQKSDRLSNKSRIAIREKPDRLSKKNQIAIREKSEDSNKENNTESITPTQTEKNGVGEPVKFSFNDRKKGASPPVAPAPSPGQPVPLPPVPPVPRSGDPFYRNRDVEQCNVKLSDWLTAYQVKGCNEETKIAWLALTDAERLKVMEHTPRYIASRPIVRKRRSPSNYLSLKEFNADIVDYNEPNPTADRNDGPPDPLGPGANLSGKVYTQKRFGRTT